MLCKLTVHLDTDLPYWVDKRSFLKHFNQLDFINNRNIQTVVNAYLHDWFDNQCFLIPPVSVKSGVTQFIGGRHRTAVLIAHMNKVPISFDSRILTSTDQNWINSVISSPINLASDTIDLPNFPIKASLL